jgi:hypothetical protein
MPLWAAVTVVAVAYVIRSVSRGFDFRPDVPFDILLLAIFAGMVIAIILARRSVATDEAPDRLGEQVEHEDDQADGDRQHDDVLGEVE